MKKIDLLAIHGINTIQHLEQAVRQGGCVDVVKNWQKKNLIGHIGFSTHGESSLIEKAIATNLFDYVNLHWYFINQSNLNEVAHGGFLMAYADSVGGFFAYNTVKKGIVTINLNSQFIRPVPVGAWLEAVGKVKKYGKRLVFVNIDMYIKKQLVFSSTGTWQIINIDKH